jgi:tetratricopeptide (TPR) repeat protein
MLADDEAIADFDRAIELDGGNPQYYCQRADLRVRKGANDDAIADYTAALQKAPGTLGLQGPRQAYLAQGTARSRSPISIRPCASSPALDCWCCGRANNFAKSTTRPLST